MRVVPDIWENTEYHMFLEIRTYFISGLRLLAYFHDRGGRDGIRAIETERPTFFVTFLSRACSSLRAEKQPVRSGKGVTSTCSDAQRGAHNE